MRAHKHLSVLALALLPFASCSRVGGSSPDGADLLRAGTGPASLGAFTVDIRYSHGLRDVAASPGTQAARWSVLQMVVGITL